ncbi:MAG TPA: sugar ABC transporter permease [Chloroflexia bacterium]|nr:sugar ABC transporter permease [Chloroflexia bacterium]
MATENKVELRPSPVAAKRPGFWVRTREARTAYVYLLPAGIVMSIITLFPLGFQIWMSFTDYGLKNLRADSAPPNFVGFDNYVNILSGNKLRNIIPTFDFWRILFFNLWWALSNVVLHVILGVLVAVLLNVQGLWFKRIYRAIYVLPVVIPPIIIATVWKNLFDTDSGAFNTLLKGMFGIFGVPSSTFNIPWLENQQPHIGPLPLAYFALLIANVWLGWPLNAVVATGGLQSIPKDLYEAATVDGATSRQQFINITAPLLRPAMIPFAVYGFVVTFNLFFLSYFMSEGRPFGETEILVTQAFKLVNGNNLYGYAAAFSIYIFFILLIISLITNRITKATASAYE